MSLVFRRSVAALGIVALVAMAPVARAATYTFTPLDLSVDGFGVDVSLSGAPAGEVFNHYTLSFDWTGNGDPNDFSRNAAWYLADDPGAGTIYSEPDAAPNSDATTTPVTLVWSEFLQKDYVGGDPLSFSAFEFSPGGAASWNHVTLTLDNIAATPPAITTPLSLPGPGGQLTDMGTMAPKEVKWYSFVYGGDALDIDTLGSSLSPDNDTEIAIFDMTGQVIAENDDIDSGNGNLLSRLVVGNSLLTTGDTYYLAVAGFPTDFFQGFSAITRDGEGSSVSGGYQLNVVVVPEVGTGALALLAAPALGTLALARRRRKG